MTYLEYMDAAMRKAQFEQVGTDAYFGTIPGFDGLWAQGATVEAARADLYSALDGWLHVNFHISGFKPPTIDGDSTLTPPPRTDDD